MKSRLFLIIPCLLMMTWLSGCGVYSMSGVATSAKSITVDQFFNNTDLGPANLAQDFTNRVKDYYQQNSSLRIVPENGELQIEGTLTGYTMSPIAPSGTTGTTAATAINTAALTRLTITIKVTYVDNNEPKNSFKDKTFSFYQDFDSTINFTTVQEDLQKKIFDQILIDIFNATVANW